LDSQCFPRRGHCNKLLLPRKETGSRSCSRMHNRRKTLAKQAKAVRRCTMVAKCSAYVFPPLYHCFLNGLCAAGERICEYNMKGRDARNARMLLPDGQAGHMCPRTARKSKPGPARRTNDCCRRPQDAEHGQYNPTTTSPPRIRLHALCCICEEEGLVSKEKFIMIIVDKAGLDVNITFSAKRNTSRYRSYQPLTFSLQHTSPR
jgi:hypothetical protein